MQRFGFAFKVSYIQTKLASYCSYVRVNSPPPGSPRMDYPKPLKLIQDGKIDDFIQMINSSDDPRRIINIKHEKSGDNAAIVAARHGRLQVLGILHRNGMDFELWNADGKRAIHEAAYGADLECVKFLINIGVEFDCLKRADWTPLMLACTKPNIAVIDVLVTAGANLVQCNKDGWDSFHIATREGHVNILEYLRKKLKESGSWSSKRCSKNGRTPLHTAALHGKTEAVKYLVDNCDYMPDVSDSCGATPLMDALRSGYIAIAEYLITHHKASVHACDKLGHQPIHLAAQTGCIDSMAYLISQHNIDPQTRTEKTAMTPLHFASKEGQSDVIRYLAGLGVDVNAQDNQKRTALHLASAAGHVDSVRLLLFDIKADASILDTNGKTAQDLAIKPSVKELFK